MLQLEAQIQFKLGNFSACIGDYEKLLQKQQKIESDEVKSNVIAAYVSGGRSQEVPAVMDAMKVSARNNFNLAYNAACALTERGDYGKAEEHLLLARRYSSVSNIVIHTNVAGMQKHSELEMFESSSSFSLWTIWESHASFYQKVKQEQYMKGSRHRY